MRSHIQVACFGVTLGGIDQVYIYIFVDVISSVWLQGKDKTPNCKSNKKTSEKFNNHINKQETKGSNNCVGKYKNAVKLRRKCS